MEDSRFSRLTPRQRDCLRLTYELRTTKEIARDLGLSVGTVSGYLSEAIAILGAPNRRAAAIMFHEYEAPFKNEGQFAGVSGPSTAAAHPVATSTPSSFWGPLDPRNRESDNEQGIIARIGWIIAIAIALAIGFGALAAGVRTVNDLAFGGGRVQPR